MDSSAGLLAELVLSSTGKPAAVLSQLLEQRSVSIYQDVVVAGQTIRTGRRDCELRWQALEPHLPASGVMLDVGSNFGWFGLKACESRPRMVVASVEADERSAAIQRGMLETHAHRRMVMLTRRAGARMARVFAWHSQHFDAVLCLSVLHWMRDHEQFLRTIGAISHKIFVELPDLAEQGAGLADVRRQIGATGDYLRRLFPDRRCVRLTQTASHRDATLAREIWMVEQTEGPELPAQGLDIAALLRLSPSWPAQSWWRGQLDSLTPPDADHGARLVLAHAGLRWSDATGQQREAALSQIRRQVATLPEENLLSRRDWIARRVRGTIRRLLRRQ